MNIITLFQFDSCSRCGRPRTLCSARRLSWGRCTVPPRPSSTGLRRGCRRGGWPSTVLYCIVLHCTALYCTVLHCTALYCTVLHCTALYCTVLHCTALYCTVLNCTVLHCTGSWRGCRRGGWPSTGPTSPAPRSAPTCRSSRRRQVGYRGHLFGH